MFALNLDGFPSPTSPTPSASLGISAFSASYTSPTSSTSALSAHAQQRPQPQSPHTLTSQLSGYPGVGGILSFSMHLASATSVHGACPGPVGALRAPRAFAPTDPLGTLRRPLVCPEAPKATIPVSLSVTILDAA